MLDDIKPTFIWCKTYILYRDIMSYDLIYYNILMNCNVLELIIYNDVSASI